MNFKIVLKTVGKLLWAEAIILCLPLLVSLYYKENLFHIYLIVMGLLLGAGALMNLPKPEKRTIYAREGFAVVSLSWVLLSFFGALPFVFSGEIPSLIDAMFEVVSGFTTTGATILADVESISKSLLFWRAFTHWLGGMGIISNVEELQKTVDEINYLIANPEIYKQRREKAFDFVKRNYCATQNIPFFFENVDNLSK